MACIKVGLVYCIVVDDPLLHSILLQHIASNYESLDFAGACKKNNYRLSIPNNEKIRLIFIDIQGPPTSFGILEEKNSPN